MGRPQVPKAVGTSEAVTATAASASDTESAVTKATESTTPQLLNNWWPVAFDHALTKDAPMAVQCFGEPLVLYRDRYGTVVCAQDRCIHKSCPLSLGSCQDGQLVCRYHGWAFGEEGKLTHVPSEPADRTPKAMLEGYPTTVRNGVIYIYPGDLKQIDQARLPDPVRERCFSGKAIKDWKVSYQEAILEDTPFDMAIDINIDFTHLRFVHNNTPPGRAPQMEGTLRKFVKDLDNIEGAMVAEFLGTHGRSGGRIHFMPPCTVMTETFFEKPEFKPFPLVLVFNFVPHSPTRTKVMLQIYRDFLHEAPDWLVKDVVMNMRKVIEQDRIIMAGQLLRMRQGSPHTWMAVESDRHLLHFRKWFSSQAGSGVWFNGFKGRAVKRVAFDDIEPQWNARLGEEDIDELMAQGQDIWKGGTNAGLASLATGGPQRFKTFLEELRGDLIDKLKSDKFKPPFEF